METHGWLSLVPPLLAIVLAIWSKQVMPSLVAGIWAGSVVLESGNPLAGSIRTVDKIVAVFESPGNTRVVLFSVLVGGLIALMQRSGGVQGFVLSMQQRPIGQTHRGAGLLAMITGIVIFIESSLTCLIVGTLLLVLFVVLTRKDFGPMRAAEQRAMQEGKLIADGAQPLVSADVTEIEAPSDTPLRMRNMLIPMGVLTMAVPAGLYATGSLAIRQASSSAQGNPSPTFLSILENGSGSTAVLWGVLLAIFVAAILYRAQGIMRLDEMMRFLLKGVGGLVPMAILITGAFALGASCRELGTGAYVAGILDRSALQPQWYPAVLFLTGSVIAFATGTSWGTFAIMIPIAVPLMTGHEHLLPLAVAGVLGGGVFGDHCSPISDTSVVSSMACASDHLDHVKTQLPYALLVGVIAAVCYAVAGWVLG
jgi:Na+/H+ antiporter NhaC